MTMNYEWWAKILSAVNEKFNLSKNNVIEKIKEKLKAENENEYRQWGEADFDVGYLFEVENKKLTLLHLAALDGDEKIVSFLIKNGTNVDVEYKEVTPLHCAAGEGRTEIVKILIANGANINAEIDSGEAKKGITPLHCAAGEGRTEIVKILIANHANINAKMYVEECEGYTPLHVAAEEGYVEVVKILIASGADPLLKNEDGKTPRDLAKNDDIKKLLKEAEEKQLRRQALKKSVVYGGTTGLLSTTAAVALFATGTIAVKLTSIVIAVAAITTAAPAVGGATYMMSKPSTKINGVEEQRLLGNEQEV